MAFDSSRIEAQEAKIIPCDLCEDEDDFIDMQQFHSESLNKLQDILKEKEQENEEMKKDLDAFTQYADECEKTLKEILATIDERKQAIQLAVAEKCEEMKKWTKTTKDRQLKEAKENRKKVKERCNDYDETIHTVKQQLQLQTAESMNHFLQEAIVEIQSLKPIVSYPIPKRRAFQGGVIDKESVCSMIGKFIEKEEVLKKSEKPANGENVVLQHMTIVRENKLDVQDDIFCICTSPAGGIWMGGRHYVYKISPDCSTILHKIPVREARFGAMTCCNIACFPAGDAVVSCNSTACIDKFTSDGRRIEFKYLLSKRERGIAVTNQDEVVISVRDRIRRRNYVHLTIFSNKGETLKRIEVSKTLERFCIDQNGNFIISDRESLCLTIIDRNGDVLKEIQTMAHGLWLLASDMFGNILGVLDNRKTVCLTSGDGKVKRSFTAQGDRDESVQDICIDRDNQLLILLDNKVIVTKYLE